MAAALMQGAQASWLADGQRLHLNHGPIDLIIGAYGPDRVRALRQAELRFQTVLGELVSELDMLRVPLGKIWPQQTIARRMVRAVAPFEAVFVTPMAAVAGAVADEICRAACDGCTLDRVFVNNGGDIAVYLGAGERLVASLNIGKDAGRVTLTPDGPNRGLATSGWRGRSHSFGIADAVTVVARTAAEADVAATLIANAVDLPGHQAVMRHPAQDLAPDSDLGTRPVTVGVGPLSDDDVERALARGQARAIEFRKRGRIASAALFLQDQTRVVGDFPAMTMTPIKGDDHARFQIA